MPYYFTKGEGNDVAVTLIGIIDIISGIIIFFSRTLNLTSNSIIAFLTFFYFCLGIWSLATNAIRRNFLDWRGMVDIMSAICLILIFYGSYYEIFRILGTMIVIKGILGIFLMTTKEMPGG
jgi:uncharacterized membrane protein HdeD (DUF308 family)